MPENLNVEDVLGAARLECLRGLLNASTYGGRSAWYYTHCGEIEMAFNLGLLTQERFDELRREWREHQPTA